MYKHKLTQWSTRYLYVLLLVFVLTVTVKNTRIPFETQVKPRAKPRANFAQLAATHWPFAGTSWLSALLALKNTRLPFETHVKPRAEPRAALESRKSLARYYWPDSNSFYIVISETTHSWGKWLILAGGECFRICLPYHEILRFHSITELRPFKVKKVDAKFCTFSHSCVLFLP